MTERIHDILEDNNIYIVDVPANCTDRLQPMDLSVNKSIKEHLKSSFQLWYANQVSIQLDQGGVRKPIDLRLSVVKPLGAQWFMNAFAHVKNHCDIIKNGFHEAGITDMLQE